MGGRIFSFGVVQVICCNQGKIEIFGKSKQVLANSLFDIQ